MFNIVETKGLLSHGNTSAHNQTHGSSGCIVDTTDISQTVCTHANKLESLKRKKENGRSTIQLLQKRVVFLEAELTKVNASNSSRETSTYQMNMEKLIQNVATNEENDRNLTQWLDALVKHFRALSVQIRYTSLSLLDVHSLTKKLNGSMIQFLEKKIIDVPNQIASMNATLFYEKRKAEKL